MDRWSSIRRAGRLVLAVVVVLLVPCGYVGAAGHDDPAAANRDAMVAGSGSAWPDANPGGGAMADAVPLPEPLASFTACEENGRVVVAWETAFEAGTVGFFVERMDAGSGSFRPLHDQLLVGLLTAPQGGTYRYVDREAAPGKTYTYRIVEVPAKGPPHIQGPYTVTVTPKAPQQSASGVTGNEDTPPDDDVMAPGYTKTPHGSSPGSKARLEAMRLERAEAAARKGAGVRLTASKPSKARITVTENGLYFLPAAGIASALGMPVASVRSMIAGRQLRLTTMGNSVAYAAAASGPSGLYFYGEGIESLYTRENVYWLTPVKGGLGIGTIAGKGPKAQIGKSFEETLHFESERMSAPAMFDNPQADHWFWDYLVANDAKLGSKPFTVAVPAPAGTGQAGITLRLLGATSTNHHVLVSLNGTFIGEGKWSGPVAESFELPVNPSLLVDGNNTVQLTGVLDSGVLYSIFYVDSFDLSYARRYRAEGDQLACRGDGNPVVTIEGFSTPAISVYKLSNPKMPKLLQGLTVDQPQAGKYRVSFTPASASTPYLAVSGSGVKTPKTLASAWTSTLKNKNNEADHLIISPAELKAAAGGLADHRSSQGLKSMVVDFRDILDEFNYGVYSPRAIRDFLSRAHSSWRKAPRYVVLAGNGTNDYKNNLGVGDNLVPPLMVGTPYGLYASDIVYGDVEGDDAVPEIVVGRLPVLTAGDLREMIGKIKAYESASGDWTRRVLMVADNADSAGDFPADSDAVYALLPAAYQDPGNKVYLGAGNAAAMRTKLLRALNSGALLCNYIGHGGVDRAAAEGLLVSGDVAGLVNGAKLPVMAGMTCTMGQFAIPGYDALSERLVTHPGGGAMAVWAASAPSLNTYAVILDQGFFTALFSDGTKVLGDAVVGAMRKSGLGGDLRFMLDIYNILGDPAAEVK